MYELVPKPENELREVQENLTEIVEDPNQSSEEPKASFAQEGKPRCINPTILNYMQLMFLCNCAFTFSGVGWNLSCMILGTHILNIRG